MVLEEEKTSMVKKKILLVEDEKVLSEILTVRLDLQGYDIIAAYDGQQALDMVHAEKPDLILLDIMLPKIDGYKVCGLLKSDVRYKNIPIILLSAKSQTGDFEMGTELGADAYITKPPNHQELAETIQKLLVRGE